MNTLQSIMIEIAIQRHGSIRPVAGKYSLSECFTDVDGELWFWYNDTQIGSTHVVRQSKMFKKNS
jgi:hypothetical protein